MVCYGIFWSGQFARTKCIHKTLYLLAFRRNISIVAMATWVLETKRKILYLFSQRKIQSLDFLMNLLNAYNE